jgi:NifU-like protein
VRHAGSAEGAPLTTPPSGADDPFGVFHDHAQRPRRVGQTARVDLVAELADQAPGRSIRVTCALDRFGRIADVAYRTDAHGSTLAACSLMAEMAIGKLVAEVLWITPEELAAALGPLPSGVEPPVLILQQALLRAKPYPGTSLPARPPAGPRSPLADEELVCWCFHRTAGMLRAAIRDGDLGTIAEVRAATRATGGCGTCRPEVKALLREAGRDPGPD